MAKKNYGNRPSSKGTKLAQIIAKDLIKQVSTRPSSLAQRKTHSLELCVAGGNLADEGLHIVCQALEEALSPHENGHSLQLESLDLSHNKLTVRSLATLSASIKLARFDLKDLDISHNHVRISSAQDAAHWDKFLSSFAYCPLLRRVNFEANDFSNPLAFEIFLRKYKSADASNVDRENGPDTQLHSASSDERPLTKSLSDKFSKWRPFASSPQPDADKGSDTSSLSSLRSAMCQGTVLQKRRGLSSIPYLVFRGVNMTDAGALLLSYVLEAHCLPQYFGSVVKPTHLTKQIEEYAQKDHCHGLVYFPNERITKEARKVLELAELNRPGNEVRDDLSLHTREDYNVVEGSTQQVYASHRRASQQGTGRRPSVASTASGAVYGHSSKARYQDLESARVKIQRSVIKEGGVASVQLWASALKYLTISRTVTHVRPAPTTPWYIVSQSCIPPGPQQCPTESQQRSQKRYLEKVEKFSAKVIPTALAKWSGLTAKYDHDPQLLGRLPGNIWATIVRYTTGFDDILSVDQQVQIIRYAKDKARLGLELQRLGKEPSQQIWAILDGMHCLGYDRDDAMLETGDKEAEGNGENGDGEV